MESADDDHTQGSLFLYGNSLHFHPQLHFTSTQSCLSLNEAIQMPQQPDEQHKDLLLPISECPTMPRTHLFRLQLSKLRHPDRALYLPETLMAEQVE